MLFYALAAILCFMATTHKNTEFWKARTTVGRPRLFKDPVALLEACMEYVQWAQDNPLYSSQMVTFQGSATLKEVPKMRAMTIHGLCNFLDISQESWRKWGKEDTFIGVVTRVNNVLYQQKFEGAAAELLNSNIIARDLGLSDKSHVDLSNPDGTLAPTMDMSKLSTEAIRELLAAREAIKD